MTQNTIENKAIFIALYWMQSVLFLKGNDRVDYAVFMQQGRLEDACLRLRELSSITDEEAIEVARICGTSFNHVERDDTGFWVWEHRTKIKKKYHSQYFGECVSAEFRNGMLYMQHDDMVPYEGSVIAAPLYAFDYLRSRGFLLPFKDLSVEQILAYGWAVLKPSTDQ